MNIDPKKCSTKIDFDELVKVTLDLGKYRQPHRQRRSGGRLRVRLAGASGLRRAQGRSLPESPQRHCDPPGHRRRAQPLCFNSHMDTTIDKDEWWTTRPPPIPSSTRLAGGDVLIGNGVCNCKGPMATWLLAAKAIKEIPVSSSRAT